MNLTIKINNYFEKIHYTYYSVEECITTEFYRRSILHINSRKEISMVKVNVKNGTLDQKEIDAYVQYAIDANPGKLVTELDINLDGEYADLTYHFGEIPFDRIRRITGYLVGTLDRFNNAKKAEVEDRVKHSITPEAEDDIYISA